MRVGLQKLVNSSVDMVQGNHMVLTSSMVCKFIYHSTCICEVNHQDKTFKTSNGGYGTITTTQAINQYKRYFLSIGYKEVA